MKRVFIYGAGIYINDIISKVEKKSKIIGILDVNEKKWGTEIGGYKILGNANYLKDQDYDEIILAANSIGDITDNLVSKGVPEEKIIVRYVITCVEARENFVKDLAKIYHESGKINYAVAEGGVYKGEFSKIISDSFPDCPYYLFDTFEGFNKKDILVDENGGLSEATLNNRFGDTSEELVLKKLSHPEKAIICKGYFPDTTNGIPDCEYGFVMLDFDLYKPTLEGLRYFYPRMMNGGVILCHDYYGQTFTGVRKAIEEYKEELNGKLTAFPIGDRMSVAIIKIE